MNGLATLEGELAEKKARFTALGLELPEDMDLEGWAAVGRRLVRADQVVKWWLGDWAAFGARNYGKLKEFADANGINSQTLMNLAWVSGAVTISRRRENLEWSKHAEVAALPAREQSKWLAKAESENLPVAELRQQIRIGQGEKNALEGDGPVVRFASKAFDDANSFLEKTPAEFWEDPERWEAWRERLRPAHERWVWIEERMKEGQ